MQVVESEFGFHVLRVTGIVAGKSRSYEEGEEGDRRGVGRQKDSAFAESAENFSNMVYEQSDSLKGAAERFKLQIQSTGWIAKSARRARRARQPEAAVGALFVRRDQEQAQYRCDRGRAQHRGRGARGRAPAAAQRKLEEVKGEITELLRNREASALALKDGNGEARAAAQGQDAGVKWSAPRMISRRESQGFPPNVARRVFGADTAKLPAYVGIPLPMPATCCYAFRVVDEPAKEVDPQAVRAARLMATRSTRPSSKACAAAPTSRSGRRI